MREPTLSSPAGKAWLLESKSPVPDHQACLTAWLINVPRAHPFWQWWTVNMIHLRDIPGVRPAHKQYASAEYEFMIAAINPEQCPNPDPDKVDEGYPFLHPLDVTEQFDGVSDAEAVRICEGAVRTILAGEISPDQDYRSWWHELIQNTVRHFKDGLHPAN